MANFRLLNNFPVYLTHDGQPAAGGELRYYETGTSDPKSVYADPGLTIDNGSTVALLSDGRTAVDTWGSGSYRVRLYAADGTMISEADDVEVAGGDATTIPALVDGQFLTNNGALLLWAPILQLPDPTGQDGKYPVADGSGYVLVSPTVPPTPPDPEIVVGAASFQAGTSADPTKFYLQLGAGSAPATGSVNTSQTVTFAVAFSTTPKVFVQASSDSNPGGPMVAELTAVSTSGFTVLWTIAAGNLSSAQVVNAVPFDYIAVGTLEVP